MGEKIPVLKPTEMITLLEKQGFSVVRQKGSHVQLSHPDGRFTTVPMHLGRDLSPIIFKKVCRDIKITPAELLRS